MCINGITRHQCMESQLKAKPTDRGYFSSRFFNLVILLCHLIVLTHQMIRVHYCIYAIRAVLVTPNSLRKP